MGCSQEKKKEFVPDECADQEQDAGRREASNLMELHFPLKVCVVAVC